MDVQSLPGSTDIPVCTSSESLIVTCLYLSDDHIITALDTGIILVHSLPTVELLHTLKGHLGGIWCLAVSNDAVISGSTDQDVRVWDLSTGRCTHNFRGHTGTVRAMVLLRPELMDVADETGLSGREKWPKSSLIISGSRDKSLRVWCLPRQGEVEYNPPVDGQGDRKPPISENPYHNHHLKGHKSGIRCLAGRGRTVISASYDRSLRVWDVISGTCTWELTGHTDKVYSVVYDSKHNQAFSSSMDTSVRLWDLKTGQCKRVLTGHTSLVGLLGLSPSYLVSTAADATACVWDRATGDLKHILINPGSTVITCQHHDDIKLITGCESGINLWDLEDGALIDIFAEQNSHFWQVGFNGRWCVGVCGKRGGTVLRIWNFGGHSSWGVGAIDEDERVYQEDERDLILALPGLAYTLT